MARRELVELQIGGCCEIYLSCFLSFLESQSCSYFRYFTRLIGLILIRSVLWDLQLVSEPDLSVNRFRKDRVFEDFSVLQFFCVTIHPKSVIQYSFFLFFGATVIDSCVIEDCLINFGVFRIILVIFGLKSAGKSFRRTLCVLGVLGERENLCF